MTYYISRNGQKFGPYSLADVQRYVASGEIVPDDLAQSEGMQDWVPVAQIIGNIAAPGPSKFPPQSYGQVPAYGPPGANGPTLEGGRYPLPPNLHWALLILLTVLSCGLLQLVWMFVQAAYTSKLDRKSSALIFYGIGIPCLFAGSVIKQLRELGDAASMGSVIYFGGLILVIIGHYKIKGSLEDHFNSVEPINLRLSGGMTFFFNTVYFQYHFNRINRWRKTGVLS